MRVAQLWRYPIKAHGSESIESVELTKGRTLPGDRQWAVAHEAAKADGSEWVPCANFSRGAKAPALMAIRARSEADGRLTLSHPDLRDLLFDPRTEGAALIDWSAPLIPDDRAQSARLVGVPGRGMTDTDFPSISLLSLPSLSELSGHAGTDLSPLRFRGNIWFDDGPAWAEWDLIGKRLRIGDAVLEVRERITRCRATMSNPETGRIDVGTLDLLESHYDHRDFGVYLTVEEGGRIAVGDRIELLP